jgi:hypothetical protein
MLFDIDALCDDEAISVTAEPDKIIVGRPRNQDWFRVFPGMRREPLWFIFDQDDRGKSYVVMPQVARQLGETDKRHCPPCRLVVGITREGRVFLWPLKLLTATGERNAWFDSLLEIADIAQSEWVQLVNKGERWSYAKPLASDPWPDPEPLTLTWSELLKSGFGEERIIASMDNPFLSKLLGRR